MAGVYSCDEVIRREQLSELLLLSRPEIVGQDKPAFSCSGHVTPCSHNQSGPESCTVKSLILAKVGSGVSELPNTLTSFD